MIDTSHGCVAHTVPTAAGTSEEDDLRNWTELITKAASLGSLVALKLAQQALGARFAEHATAAASLGAARLGHDGLPILQWLSSLNLSHLWTSSCGPPCVALDVLQLLSIYSPELDPSRELAWLLQQPIRLPCQDQMAALRHLPDARGSVCMWTPLLCDLAARLKDYAALRRLRGSPDPCPLTPRTFLILFKSGAWEELRWLVENNCSRGEISDCIEIAIDEQEVGFVRWLKQHTTADAWTLGHLWNGAEGMWPLLLSQPNPCPLHEWCIERVAASGNLTFVQQLYASHGIECWKAGMINAAARMGHIHILKWAWGKLPISCWTQACGVAWLHKQLSLLRWLLAQDDPPITWETPIHQWPKSRRGDLWACLDAHSRLPAQSWLSPGVIPLGPKPCRHACASNNYELLAWLRAHGRPWEASLCDAAAHTGNLQMLHFLHAQDPPCPWSPRTSQNIAVRGDLETLQWLLQQDPPCPFPFHPERATDACLLYLVQCGCPMTPSAQEKIRDGLSGPLVLGLTRWYQCHALDEGLDAAASQQLRIAADPPAQLLQNLARLPETVIFRICQVAALLP